ncbi:hypothetical protein [Rhizorhabdus histidinilytica]|uniref:Uncharacterized protein n=1 Tax=Rhizorhabdus histidinilytica TaxID=439228 RepID=A0A1T5A7D2_9SPHN|nr:hypothetical protein [Rhizorhabdus histidinilytica]SKB30838.1 hypothetical protein SAMN06295920_101668 [Rhizorhabdus histidinilytica]
MTTAGDLINGALRLLGVLAEGEVPSADTSQDCLSAFDQMVDSWNTERLSVYSTIDQTFTWPAGERIRTLGPSGNFVGIRPIQLMESTYFIGPSNLSFGVQFVNEDQYNGIALKTVTSTYPNVIWVNNTFPDVTMHVYPVPTSSLLWHFISVQTLDQPAALSTDVTLPPGYLRAFRYNLACELAPEFGVEPSGQVVRIAVSSKRNLKRINNPDDLMALPYPLIVQNTRFNIYSGSYG